MTRLHDIPKRMNRWFAGGQLILGQDQVSFQKNFQTFKYYKIKI
jgi:hypothetical protein